MSEKKIGIVKATSLVAGNMIGSGALLAPALLAPYGSWALVGWCVTTFGVLALALCFARLSGWIPHAGGPYTYAKHVFGDFMGFQMAWGYWISTWCGSASLVIGALQYISLFFPDLLTSMMGQVTLGLSMIWLFTIINLRGITETVRINVVILVIKILPIILFALVGIFYFNSDWAFRPLVLPENGVIGLSAMAPALLWAFIGLESATIPSNHIENPKKAIPIATISGVLITACIYILGTIVIYGVLPQQDLLSSNAPFVDAAYNILGSFGKWFMAITGIIGIIGSLNGWILIQGEVSLSAAKDGLFPKLFTKTNKRGVPAGVLIGSIFMSVLFLLSYKESLVKQVELLINFSVFAMLLPYFYSVAATIYVFLTKRTEFSFGEKAFLFIITTIAAIYTFFAIFSAGETIIFFGFLAFLVGSLSYVFSKKK